MIEPKDSHSILDNSFSNENKNLYQTHFNHVETQNTIYPSLFPRFDPIGLFDHSNHNHNDTLNSSEESYILDDTSDNIFTFYPIIEPRATTVSFKIRKIEKRGRPTNKNKKNSTKEKHGKSAFDNIHTKIQVHFIRFLINLVNDAIFTEFKSRSKLFKDIKYEEKRKINYEYTASLCQDIIKNIFLKDVSGKFKKISPEYNQNLCQELEKKSKWFSEFLKMKYIDVFNLYYYNGEKPLVKMEFNGKTIIISKTTKSFYYLLKKESNLAYKMINIIKCIYLDKTSYIMKKENPFVTIKNDN